MMVTLTILLFCKTSSLEKETDLLRQKNEAIEAINNQTRQLAHHQRLETIGVLTSSIAHEFNNLLTPIMGYSLMALEKLSEDSQLYEEMIEIYESSRQAKEIISRLNDLSRKNNGNVFRQISPDDLIKKTITVATPAKPSEVEIRLDLNCWDQRIQANEIQFSQMILNLVLNAFHAMDRGGVLSVTTSFDEDSIFLRFEDTGRGISEDILPKIFEPFFTTKETGRGTGLGLAIVAQVVEDHHGEIQVSSQVGEGTVFLVRLPRSTIPPDESINNY
jgi:signal transduction histidine kinase